MKENIKELQKLKGVGKVLSQRLFDAGYRSLSKIAKASEEELKKIVGINPGMIPVIIAHASELKDQTKKIRVEKVDELRRLSSTLKCKVHDIAKLSRDRYSEEVSGKTGKKLDKEIIKIVSTLEKVEEILEKKVKRAGKGLVIAEKSLEGVADYGLEVVVKGMKRARKSLKKVLAK